MSDELVEFSLGDLVYLRIAPDDPGMVTGIVFRPGHVRYLVTWVSTEEIAHYAMELTTEKDWSAVTTTKEGVHE